MSLFSEAWSDRIQTAAQRAFGRSMTYKPYKGTAVALTGRRRGEESREETSNVGRVKVFTDRVEIRSDNSHVDGGVASISLRDKVEIDGREYDVVAYEDGTDTGSHLVDIKRYEILERSKQNLRRNTQ